MAATPWGLFASNTLKPTNRVPNQRPRCLRMAEWFRKARRLQQLPPYLFAEIDRKKAEAIRAGRDVINLGVGDPDLPTPEPIVRSLQRHVENPAFHRYALDQGALEFRAAVARWFERRYNVALDPETEVLALIGSKEGIAHLPLGLVDPGDVVLVPDPAYPVYATLSRFAGAEVHRMPLDAARGFLPDLEGVHPRLWERCKLVFLNYPNNPTTAVADEAFYQELVERAHRYRFLIAQDAAYAELYYDRPPLSILQVPGAREVAIEFHSFSKTFNMTGWRLAFAVGAAPVVAALAQVKANCDSGVFTAIQFAGIDALEAYQELTEPLRATYRRRRDTLLRGLQQLGWSVRPPAATFYLWVSTPAGLSSTETATRLLEQADIVVTPGVGFGQYGEGYVRFALTVPEHRIQEAVDRIGKLTF